MLLTDYINSDVVTMHTQYPPYMHVPVQVVADVIKLALISVFFSVCLGLYKVHKLKDVCMVCKGYVFFLHAYVCMQEAVQGSFFSFCDVII